MLTNVRGLIAELSFQTKNLKQAQEFQDRIENIRASLEGMAAMAKKAAAGFAILTAGIGKVTYDLGNATAEIQRNSLAVGASVEDYQALSYAFERLDLNANDMMDTLTQVSDRVLAASTGSKNYADALKRLGLSHEELLALDPAQALARIADAARTIENPMERAAIAASLLGEESARKLLPALTAGGKALSEYMDEARKAGAIMTKEQIEKGRKVSESYNRLKLILKVLRNDIALSLAPMVIRFTTRLHDWYKANKDLITQKIDEYAKRLSAAFERLYQNFKRVNDAVGGFEGWADIFEKIAKALGVAAFVKFSFYLGNLALAVKGLAVAMAGALGVAIGKIVALVIIATIGFLGLLAVFEDVITYMQGGESMVGFFISRFKELNPLAKVFMALWGSAAGFLMATALMVTNYLLPSLKKLIPVLKIVGFAVLFLVGLFVIAISFIVAFVTAYITVLVTLAGYAVELFSAIFSGLWDALSWFFDAIDNFIPKLKRFIGNVGEVIMGGLTVVKDFLSELIDDLLGLPSKAAEALSAFDLGGMFDVDFGFGGASPAPAVAGSAITPSTAGMVASRAPNSATNVQQQQTTTINVNGSDDPTATAREVARRQKDVNETWANSAYQQARGGNR